MRRAARIDGNHTAVRQALEVCGATVLDLSGVGEGAPDLCVGFRGKTYLIEIKNSALPPSKRRLTGPQQRFHSWWRGSTIHIVESVNAALALLKPTNNQ